MILSKIFGNWRDREGLRLVTRKHFLAITRLFDDVHIPAAAVAIVLIVPAIHLCLTELLCRLHFAVEFYFDHLALALIAHYREGRHWLHGGLLVGIDVVDLTDVALFDQIVSILNYSRG